MMSHISRDSHRYPAGSPSRYYDRCDERDGRMYDDRSRSRSRSADRRRRSLGYEDYARPPPPRSAGDGSRDYSGNREPGVRYGSKDSDERWRRSSRSPPPRRGRPAYRDRDHEGYRSPPYSGRNGSYSRSRSRSPRRGRQAYHGHESKEVMLDGLPIDMVEEDVSKQLHENYHVQGLEDVRVIRDRQTKLSRQIAFLTFRSLGDSRAFVERNFPSMNLVGPGAARDDRGRKVRIAYSRDREDRNRGKGDGDWTCGNCAIMNYGTRHRCFRCQAPRPDPTVVPPQEELAPKILNNGDNDTSPDSQPSQFLLFRGLDSSVSEELFGKGVAKLYRPATSGGESQSSSQKKGAKVASTTGDANLGAREGSIRRVLLVRDRSSNESWGYGFAEFATVQDAQAAIARLNSFDKFTISSKPVLVTYIHAGVFVPVMNPSANTDRFTFSPLANPALKLMYWDEEAYVTELVISTKVLDSHPKPERGTAIQSESQSKSGKDADKAKKRKAEAVTGAATGTGTKKLAVPSHLQFWSNRHAELHGLQKKDGDEQALQDVSIGIGSEADNTPVDSTAPPTQSFADLNRNCCYLCMRQFESAAEVNRHERLSQLHRDNLQKDDLKTKAMNKLIKHGIVSQSTSEYRDRAKERRQAFGNAKSSKSKAAAASAKEEVETPARAPSKGASLLGKMGWSAGSGLGAQGTGVTAPIATEVYAQGVGLGAQGSKLGDATEEANRNTRGRYDEFLEKTKQMARERYEQMS